MKPHQKGCEYYAEGGQTESKFGDEYPAQLPDESQDDPASTLGHAAIGHGLLGLLEGGLGHASLADPEKGAKKF